MIFSGVTISEKAMENISLMVFVICLPHLIQHYENRYPENKKQAGKSSP